jgi:hypothetical protein
MDENCDFREDARLLFGKEFINVFEKVVCIIDE